VNSNLIWQGLSSKENSPEENQTIPAHPRKKSNRNGQDKITLPADLPVETTVLDLPEEQKVCPETGEPLVKIGEETTRKLVLEAAAVLLSLVQTCRGLGINPREYLEDLFRRFMGHPANRLDELLSDRWLLSRQQDR